MSIYGGPTNYLRGASFHYLFDRDVQWRENGGYFAEMAHAEMRSKAEKTGLTEENQLRVELSAVGTELRKDVDWEGIAFVRSRTNVAPVGFLSTQVEYFNGMQLNFFVSGGGTIRVLPYHSRGVFQWSKELTRESPVWVSPSLHSTLATLQLQAMLQEFESLLNSPLATEHDMQTFLEGTPLLLRLLGFSDVRPHVVLMSEEGGRFKKLIPDFMVRPVESQLWDIVELKSPRARVVVGNEPRARLSQQVMAASQQLREYYQWFEKPGNRAWLEKEYQAYGIRAYRPGLTLVLGSHPMWERQEIRRLASQHETPITIHTYDELLILGNERLLL